MRLIKLSGLFFLYRALQQHSLRALIIFINGVLNHGLTTKKNYYNKNIKLIRNYDIVGNAIMTIYTFYKYPQSRIYGIYFIYLSIHYSFIKDRQMYSLANFLMFSSYNYPFSLD